MITFRYGGKAGTKYSLEISDDLLAVRALNRAPVAEVLPYDIVPVSVESRSLLAEFDLVNRFADAGVDVLRSRISRGSRNLRDEARTKLKAEAMIEFAGRVLTDPKSKAPILYTENLFIKFDDDASATQCRQTLKKHHLTIKETLQYSRNAYFVSAKAGIGLDVFDLADKLLNESIVELSHPELIRRVRRRAASPQQWHLKRASIDGRVINAHSNVESAWAVTQGEGITIAIIDDGVDVDHEEFRSSGKIIAPRDVTRKSDDARPGNRNNHGTACAGVACASGQFGASGVAPKARLMPIRLVSGLGSQAEADAFIWAAQHGADVISCSWGPWDGDWTNPADPLHNEVVPLPDNTRLAIDWTIANGRNGKGCVITWAAGNGNESADNDGYASYSKVISVAACNDQSRRSAYSDFGKSVWCSFPSNHGAPSLTPGIWTTDRSGATGYNSGDRHQGDIQGNYTNSFGGTSSAAPGVAGVAALVLARNPELRWDEVKNILKAGAEQIDRANGNYDATGHSTWYGYGRVNTRQAVDAASPGQGGRTVTFSAIQDVPIRDLKTARLDVPVAETAKIKGVKITVDIEHTYIGDLVVTIEPPANSGVQPVTLHNREGRGTDNIKKSFDVLTTPTLSSLIGIVPTGTWRLVVADKDNADTGRIRSIILELNV